MPVMGPARLLPAVELGVFECVLMLCVELSLPILTHPQSLNGIVESRARVLGAGELTPRGGSPFRPPRDKKIGIQKPNGWARAAGRSIQMASGLHDLAQSSIAAGFVRWRAGLRRSLHATMCQLVAELLLGQVQASDCPMSVEAALSCVAGVPCARLACRCSIPGRSSGQEEEEEDGHEHEQEHVQTRGGA